MPVTLTFNFPHGLEHVIDRMFVYISTYNFHVKDLADGRVNDCQDYHLDTNETLFSRERLWFVKNIFILFYVSHRQHHIPGIPQSIGTPKPRKDHMIHALYPLYYTIVRNMFAANCLISSLWVLVDKSIFVCLQRPHTLPPRRFKCVDETELSYLCFYRSDELLDEVYGCLASTFKPYQSRLLCGNLQCIQSVVGYNDSLSSG